METDRFDALTACLAQGLTRRRGLGLLAALGMAATEASSTEARKRKKGKKKGKKKPKPPCGGACGDCQACIAGKCTLVADDTACNGGTCFTGQCLRCPGGKVPLEGRCATPCSETVACAPGAQCSVLQSDLRETYCVILEPFDSAPACTDNTSLSCGAGRLCMSIAMTPKCLVAA